jgi:MSHA biogenesis protein MshJ
MTQDDLKKQFQGFTNRIDAMSIRERALIFITILVALYFLAVNVLFGPVNAEKDRLQQQVNQKRMETQTLEAQVPGADLLAGHGLVQEDVALPVAVEVDVQ